jgi:hypothetical protein
MRKHDFPQMIRRVGNPAGRWNGSIGPMQSIGKTPDKKVLSCALKLLHASVATGHVV